MSDEDLRRLERRANDDPRAEAALRRGRCRSGQCCAHADNDLPLDDRFIWVPFRRSGDGKGERYPCYNMASERRMYAVGAVENFSGRPWSECRHKSQGDWRVYRCEVRVLPLPGGRRRSE